MMMKRRGLLYRLSWGTERCTQPFQTASAAFTMRASRCRLSWLEIDEFESDSSVLTLVLNCSCDTWESNPVVTMDLTDENIGHFLNEVMLPTWHGLLNTDLIPAHVKKCVPESGPGGALPVVPPASPHSTDAFICRSLWRPVNLNLLFPVGQGHGLLELGDGTGPDQLHTGRVAKQVGLQVVDPSHTYANTTSAQGQ